MLVATAGRVRAAADNVLVLHYNRRVHYGRLRGRGLLYLRMRREDYCARIHHGQGDLNTCLQRISGILVGLHRRRCGVLGHV